MKFKSDKDVTMTPVNFEDIVNELDNVLNMELEQAVEHLDDLEILYANIEKYGITEPVMHLVGGTLESMSISIADKESCLEGLKEGLKEAGKRVWEVIVKIFTKIIELITGDRAEAIYKRCDKLLDETLVQIKAEHEAAIGGLGGILDRKETENAKDVAMGWSGIENIHNYLKNYGSVVIYGGDEITYHPDVDEWLNASPLKAAMTHGDTHHILFYAKSEIIAAKHLKGYAETCLKAAEKFLKNTNVPEPIPDVYTNKAKELKLSARVTNMIVSLLFKDATNKLKVVEAIYKAEKSKDESK